MTKHGYDWEKMDFRPNKNLICAEFIWDETPEGHEWWMNNGQTEVGRGRFAEMKRLYAIDMAGPAAPEKTLRDEFAMAALETLHNYGCGADLDVSEIGEACYQIADAMLTARLK